MIDESLLEYHSTFDPKQSQAYRDAMRIAPLSYNASLYDVQYHHSILDSDNVNDSIKVKVLYNEFMKLKTDFENSERALKGEINFLHAENGNLITENKRLSDEVASIKQALYFD